MELKQLGWNLMTVGFIGTLVISTILAWGALQQAVTILRHRKADSLSVTAFVATNALFLIQFIYGISLGSIALIFSGVALGMTFTLVTMLVGVYRGFSWWERGMITGFALIVALTILVEQKAEIFFTFSFATVITGVLQPWEIWRHRSAGDLDKRLIWKLFISTWFWIPYGFAVWDITLMTVPACFFCIHTVNLLLMKKFPPIQVQALS